MPQADALDDARLDCLIIGGGPAGLTAATYLARFRRRVAVIDEGKSRAALIPTSHNYPGYSGISGPDLIALMRRQAEQYGARYRRGLVTGLEHGEEHGFTALTETGRIHARTVLMATGIVDINPDLAGLARAVQDGALRYCPICDGYEAIDQRIGVLGTVKSAARKALFMRSYSAHVTLLPTENPGPEDEGKIEALRKAGVRLAGGVVRDMEMQDDKVAVLLSTGESCELDVFYPALGCNVRSDLATALGARTDEQGCLVVDQRQKTGVAGLLAAGDVVSDLDQISVAVGHAAVAATAIHNALPYNFR
jgi:thioredoxin reductase (NADPH)